MRTTNAKNSLGTRHSQAPEQTLWRSLVVSDKSMLLQQFLALVVRFYQTNTISKLAQLLLSKEYAKALLFFQS